jgi:hypothetical protein
MLIYEKILEISKDWDFEKLNEDIPEDGMHKKFTALAKKLHISKKEICLCQRVARRKGESLEDHVSFSFLYDNDINCLFKESGIASFMPGRRAWTIPEACLSDALLSDIFEYFTVVIDLDGEKIGRNKSENIKKSENPPLAPLPEPITFYKAEMLDAYYKIRPGDKILGNGISVLNISKFEPLPKGVFSTLHPLLLFRITVKGYLRYVSYSLLTREIETITYSSSKRKTARLLARFNSFHTENPIQVVHEMGEEVDRDAFNLNLRENYSALLAPVQAVCDEINAVLPGVNLAAEIGRAHV